VNGRTGGRAQPDVIEGRGASGPVTMAGRRPLPDIAQERVTGPAKGKRLWPRWALVSAGAAVVLTVGVATSAFALGPVPALFALPAGQVPAPVGPLSGTWVVGPGSKAGFRMAETVLFITKANVTGETSAVTGSFVVAADEVVGASFRVDLRTVKIGGRAQAQFSKSMGVARHPYATFVLDQPVHLSLAFASGATARTSVTGRFSVDGIWRSITFATMGRRDGGLLQVAGSAPVSLATWGIKGPAGFGPLASLDNHGVAEFVLQLRHLGS
jgi:YceI-like domain